MNFKRHETDPHVFYVTCGGKLATYWRAHTGTWWACLGDQSAGWRFAPCVEVEGGELSAQLKAIELLEGGSDELQTPQTAPAVVRRPAV